MSFIAKNPLIAPEVETSPLPPKNTRGLYPKEDGWYDINEEGASEKIATSKELEDVETTLDSIINKTASGMNSLEINDISEVPHDVTISLSSKNEFDIRPMQTSPANGNEYVCNETGATFPFDLRTACSTEINFNVLCPNCIVGAEYVLSANVDVGYEDGSFYDVGILVGSTRWLVGESIIVTEEMLSSNVCFIGSINEEIWTNNMHECLIEDIQIEEGKEITPFTEHVEDLSSVTLTVDEKTYTPDSNSMITVKSVSPDMTISCDNDGVKMTAEYNQDINKAMENVKDDMTAEIMANIANKEQWRLINQVTLTEDAVVEFTKDKDGNAFELKKMRIVVTMPQLETQSQLWLRVNSFLVVYSENIANTAKTPSVSIGGELENSWYFTTCYCQSGENNAGNVRSFPGGSRYSNSTSQIINPVKKITMALSSNLETPLPAGSKVKFWGVNV